MQNYKLPLEDGEHVELRSPGALSLEPAGRWRLGEWVKTDRRMLFFQSERVTFFVRFDDLVAVAPCEREYSFKQKRCQKITFNDGGDNKVFWFITADISLWENRILEYLGNSLTEEDIVKVANHLSHNAEKILWHLYRKRHATISELAEIVGADNQMAVLNLIRKEINQISQDTIGRSALVFKAEGREQSGRKIAYSWWFAGGKAATDGPFYDIMDEGSFYRIVVEAPADTSSDLEGNSLCLKDRRGFQYTINLPSGVAGSIHNRSYRNGMLEVCIMKYEVRSMK